MLYYIVDQSFFFLVTGWFRYIQAACATNGQGLYEGLDWLSSNITTKASRNRTVLFLLELLSRGLPVEKSFSTYSYSSETYGFRLNIISHSTFCKFTLYAHLVAPQIPLLESCHVYTCSSPSVPNLHSTKRELIDADLCFVLFSPGIIDAAADAMDESPPIR